LPMNRAFNDSGIPDLRQGTVTPTKGGRVFTSTGAMAGLISPLSERFGELPDYPERT
jgi:hypothetical protein